MSRTRSRTDQTSAKKPRREKGRGLFSLPFLAFLLLVVIPACSGSGCGGGCNGCGGITPLPGGFVSKERIENGAAVRITAKGLQFLSQNLGTIAGKVAGGGSGALSFQVPTSSGSTGPISYTVCPNGPDPNANPPSCVAEIDLPNAALSLSSGPPHELTITGTVPVRLQDLPLHYTLLFSSTPHITLSGNSSCPGGNSTFADIGVDADISIETVTDPALARFGYSRVHIVNFTISQSDIQNSLHFCGGFDASVLNLLKGLVVGQLVSPLTSTLKSTVENQLCQKSNPMVSPSCPTGTNDVGGICRYGTTDSSDCVSMVLGTDGHADLGGLLAKLSPGTKGGLDFLLAGGGEDKRDDGSGFTWGDLNTFGGGATLGMYGGVEPNPVSSCVPLSTMPRPTAIPIPQELINDSLIQDWPASTPGPHIGLALSQSFFNYALNGIYNSGLLCIGVSTEQVGLLNSGTFGLLAGSLRDLGLQRETQPIAIMIRPSSPPKVTFGGGTNIDTDPLITLELNQASFDFYMFSSDRFIRFMTATFDIRAPLNLTVTPDGLVPELKTIDVKNGVVTNSELLKDDPTVIAGALQGLLSSQVGSLLGKGIPPVDINSSLKSLGLKLVIPPTVDGQGSPGLRKLEKNGETFLGIFASFDTAAFQANVIDTSASVTDKFVDQRGLRAATITKDNAPEVTILAKSPADDGTASIEYQVRVDDGLWKPWTQDRYIRLKEEAFRLEGKHHVDVRSRIVGDVDSLDPSPARVEVIIDTVAPDVKVAPATDKGDVAVDVWDLVSKSEGTQLRYRLDDGAFTSWMPANEAKVIHVGEDAAEITFEARDEEGNLGTSTQAIIRGLPHGATAGCGCSVPAESDASPWTLGVMGVGIAAMMGRLFARRRKEPASASRGPGALLLASRKREIAGAAVVLAIAGTYSGCSCGDTQPTDGGYTCAAPNCVTLDPGLIGSYTSTAVAGDKLWVAGYLEADYDNSYQYGDLVVGKWDGTKVAWDIVDGVPSDPVDGKSFNLKGFRGGQTEPGDDVGLWTSIAIDDSGNPGVAYFDRTNKQLKFAHYDGKGWSVSVVDGGSGRDVGRYAKLHYENGLPVIAYLSIEPASTGFLTSKVRVARGVSGVFVSEDVVVNTATPCRPAFCTGGSICVADTGLCSAPATGCAMCAMGDQCVTDQGAPTCKTPVASDKLDAYPVASGLYISTAPLPGGGFGIAYYNRIDGSLNIASQQGGAWTSMVVDGGDPMTPSDVGIGTSLYVDSAGDWHLTYVDGYGETVKYARVSGGKVASIETVDDGVQVGGVPFPDGQHVVGDDSFVRTSGSGEVHVTYQDATTGKLRYAVGTPNATGHDWKSAVVDAPNFGGFFSSQVEVGGALQLVSWWRKGGDKTMGDVTVLSPP